MTFVPKSKLPRLSREHYVARAMVLWTHTIVGRATGWLNEGFHRQFRELLLHAGSRHRLACPCYVLMPDHWHMVWMGLGDEGGDQRQATAFLRKHLAKLVEPARLQDRAHDHVLREEERQRGAFQSACSYVLHNPERAGLVEMWSGWPFLGTMVPGYPDLDPRGDAFWPDFWKIYYRLAGEGREGPCAPAQGYEAGGGPCAPAQGYRECSPPREGRDQEGDGMKRPCAPAQGYEASERPCAPAQGYEASEPPCAPAQGYEKP